MTDITRHNAKIEVNGAVAADGANAVAVVIPQMGVVEGAKAQVRAANAVSVQVSISDITVTVTPSGDAGSGYYHLTAWGY